MSLEKSGWNKRDLKNKSLKVGAVKESHLERIKGAFNRFLQ
tara:strand:+ start:661 stop:783 length:123 start_codon:yes stop_codon:yes gene_type:complete